MTQPLRPSNELEVQLCAAVDRGDLESYVHRLRTATVVVPVVGQHTQLGADGAGWPVSAVDGLPHVAVFTSQEAMLTNPGTRNLGSVEMTLPELAKAWPDPDWRLAVDPGLSIAVYLPGTFVLSTGTRLGAVDPVEALQLPDIQQDGFAEIRTGTFQAGNRAEAGLLQAITTGDRNLALRALLESTLFMVSTERDGYTLPGQAGFRWLTVGTGQGDAVPVFTSRDRVDQGMGTGAHSGKYTKLPIRLLDLAEAWPNDELGLLINPGVQLSVRLPGPGVLGLPDLAEQLGIRPEESDFTPGAEPDQTMLETAAVALELHHAQAAVPPTAPAFAPASQEEQALAAAGAAGDRAAFLRILCTSTLRLTFDREQDPGARFAGQPMPWQPATVGGRSVLMVFTTPQRQREVTGSSARSSADCSNLLRYWPNPAWDLAINPGTPIGAVLPGSQIAALSQWYDQSVAHELAGSFPVGERLDLQLLDAARRGDRDGFLELLRPAKVSVNSSDRTVDWNTPPTDPRFPWEPVPVRGRRSIPVYTGTEWSRRASASGRLLRPAFAELAAAWPEGGPDLVLNPASPISITLTAEEVRAYAGG